MNTVQRRSHGFKPSYDIRKSEMAYSRGGSSNYRNVDERIYSAKIDQRISDATEKASGGRWKMVGDELVSLVRR